ncbi:MAG: alpha-N-acetylglucosaminidase TIM-barrel domain-containing protein [Clostridia bacterium]
MRVLDDFVARVLPKCKTKIEFQVGGSADKSNQSVVGKCGNNSGQQVGKSGAGDNFCVTFDTGKLTIKANCIIAAANGLYDYLKKYCNVNLSWNGNRELDIVELVPFEGEFCKVIEQKYRVYMNYCTLNYSMSWWDFSRWEKELDFMALNGINMPLAVIGTEAVWYETLLNFGYTSEKALETISGPAFWAWQLMTNIEGYCPPKDVKYVYDRLELGKKIIARMLEFGMYPIQQGFSGHAPMSMIEKFPNAKILPKRKWCSFPQTAQIDPLDALFEKFGRAFLDKQKELLGAYHFYATDPFHECSPPKNSIFYMRKVGKAIERLFCNFDSQAVWVMQSWSLRKPIVKAVKKENLLILDINSQKYKTCHNFWGYDFVCGYLHNFGGKNALQGRMETYSHNCFSELKKTNSNVVGAGLFMEGIEQNIYVYDMLFELMTKRGDVNVGEFTKNYITRRYGAYSEKIAQAYNIFLETCYKSDGDKENEVGSMIAARPRYLPIKASPCDNLDKFYDKEYFRKAVIIFASESAKFGKSDGYQFDLLDFTRQAMSDLFYINQNDYARAAHSMNAVEMENIATKQLELLSDVDELLSLRSETCLSKWLYDARKLATTDDMKDYFEYNARLLVTLWGDTNGSCDLHDYAWKEWGGLVKEYYLPRWKSFYQASAESVAKGRLVPFPIDRSHFGRPSWRDGEFYNKLADFELAWCKTCSDCECPRDKDVIPTAKKMIEKYFK